MTINVIINFEVKKESTAEFLELLSGVKHNLPNVEGCEGVSVFQNITSHNRFTLVERWENKMLHIANLDALLSDGTWDTIASHLTKEPESDYFTEL